MTCDLCHRLKPLAAWITGCLRAIHVCQDCADRAEWMHKPSKMRIYDPLG